jgi:hypothetical protein
MGLLRIADSLKIIAGEFKPKEVFASIGRFRAGKTPGADEAFGDDK